MKDIKITITNALTNVQEVEVVSYLREEDNADQIHEALRKIYPNSHVNFVMEDGFIAGVPLNMQLDQDRYEKGLITWQGYIEKWYPKLAENMEAV